MLLFVIVAAALAWMHYAIRKAERVEWGPDRKRKPTCRSCPRPLPSCWKNGARRILHSGRSKGSASPDATCGSPFQTCSWRFRSGSSGASWSSKCRWWASTTAPTSCSGWRPCRHCPVRHCEFSTASWCRLFGGRRWTAISTASLLLPCLWIGFAIQHTETPYLVMLILALLCGFGGGNFASQHGQYQLLLSAGPEGRGARSQCRPGQPGCVWHAACCSAGDCQQRVWWLGRRSHDHRHRCPTRANSCGCRMPPLSGSR